MPYDFPQPAEVLLSRSELLNACVVGGVALDTDLAAWVGSLPDISHQKLVQVGLVPICPELRAILVEAFERAEPGQTHVVPIAALLGVNLRTQLKRIITRAGHETWPRLLQNLRTSCSTDWVAAFVDWYNHRHRHSGIKFVTPHQRHNGEAVEICRHRAVVYEQARQRHPRRWTRSTRCWRQPEEVWINPPPPEIEPDPATLMLAA